MPRPLLIFSQSGYLIQIVAINLHILDGKLCRSRSVAKQGISGFSRTRVKIMVFQKMYITAAIYCFAVQTVHQGCGEIPCLTCTAFLSHFIKKTRLYNFDPLKPHFYIVKLGFTGVYIFFLFLLKNIDCGYSLEPPRRGGSNEYPQSMFLSRNMKKISEFLSQNFQFLVVKFSVYLNRHVFVMQ